MNPNFCWHMGKCTDPRNMYVALYFVPFVNLDCTNANLLVQIPKLEWYLQKRNLEDLKVQEKTYNIRNYIIVLEVQGIRCVHRKMKTCWELKSSVLSKEASNVKLRGLRFKGRQNILTGKISF